MRASQASGLTALDVTSRDLLRQIVYLQSDRIRAGAFDRVDDLHDVAVLQWLAALSRRPSSRCVLSSGSQCAFPCRPCRRAVLCAVETPAQASAESALGVVHRTHGVLIQFELQIVGDRNDQRQRIGFQLAQVFVRISLGRNVALKRLGFSGVTTMKMISSTSKHVNQRRHVDIWHGCRTALFGLPSIDIKFTPL